MINSKLSLLLIFMLSAFGKFAQDSLQVYIVNTKNDTTSYTFCKDDKSSSFVFKKKNDKIHFTEVTPFQVFDSYGNMVRSLKTDHPDLSDLKKGIYYINFYNRNEEKWLKVNMLVK